MRSASILRNIVFEAWYDLAKQTTAKRFLPPLPTPLGIARVTEWSFKFDQLMRNRMMMGFYRYGPFNRQNRTTAQVMYSIEQRAQLYMQTGNDECLIDIANLAMKEFIVGSHPKKHFNAVDDGQHT